ncbi:unnamed protein product [Amoebophrya sp. A120]|nr:unnamed protein product [Amoebophrya sp. A120]|eukprot:GSA120T00016094001.1
MRDESPVAITALVLSSITFAFAVLCMICCCCALMRDRSAGNVEQNTYDLEAAARLFRPQAPTNPTEDYGGATPAERVRPFEGGGQRLGSMDDASSKKSLESTRM